MEILSVIGSPIGIIVLGFPVLLIVLAIAIQPARRRMYELAENLLADPQFNEDEREDLNLLLDTSWSFWAGATVPLAIVSVAIDDILGRSVGIPENVQNLYDDERFVRMIGPYMLSLVAANPIAAVISVPLGAIGLLINLLVQQSPVEILEILAIRSSRAVHGRRLAI